MDPRISVPSFFMGKLRELNLFIFEFGEWKFGEAGVFFDQACSLLSSP